MAFKRFVDYVPMTIDFEMLKRFNRKLHEVLFKELAMGAEDARIRCEAFLAEAPEVINRRNGLSGKLVRLDSARLELQKVRNAVSVAPNLTRLHVRHLHPPV